jgi:fructokinase
VFDLVSVGELLVDLISDEGNGGLAGADRFRSFLGGSPGNTAITASILGGAVAAVGCVGNDGFGDKVEAGLEAYGVTPLVMRVPTPTTLALVSRSSGTPEFVIVRGADRMLSGFEAPPARWLHTSLFALSEDPQQTSILATLRSFAGLVSVDLNFHDSIWTNGHLEEVLEELGSLVDVAKASSDDCYRMFGARSSDEWVDRLLGFGFGTVLFTHGGDSVILAADGETTEMRVPERDVVDVTGAGDSFMAGVIMARLDGLPWQHAAAVGIEIAGRNVGVLGHVPGPLDRKSVYAAAIA